MKYMNIYKDNNHSIVYSYDSAAIDIKRRQPIKVIFPENNIEIINTVKNANRTNTPLYIRGAGTSVVGAGVPIEKGYVISLEKMNKIIDFDPQGKMITVQPGITVRKVNKILKRYNLQLPTYPASYRYSTIGGNISTRASGLEAVHYGTIENYVKQIKVITGNGEDITLGKKVKRYSLGLDLKNLFLGSLGQIGIIYEITGSLVPLEKKVYKYCYYGNTLKQIVTILKKIKDEGMVPIRIEYINNTITELIQDRKEYYVEILSTTKIPFLKLFKGDSIRNSLSPIMSSYKKHKISLDLSFSIKYLSKFDEFIKELNSKEIFIAYYGHIGDGVFHINICYDNYNKKVDLIVEKLYNFTYKICGAISGEHGYGFSKKKYVKETMKEQLKYIRKIKKIFDPNNILNRGLEL